MKIAIVQIRGTIGVSKTVKDTLRMLNLSRKNSCSIIDSNPQFIGMLTKVKDVSTWGEINPETLKILLEKRGRLPGNILLDEKYVKDKLNLSLDQFAKELIDGNKKVKDLPGLKPFFRLHPPRGGFEKGGIKRPFSLGGVLGYRKDRINSLIQKMI